MNKFKDPVIIIVGPTASGKTSLAVDLAMELNGEIICADSRTIYRGLDIGTAKPSFDDMRGVDHWGLDLVDPGERFTVVDFQRYALNKISEIQSRGKVPIVVGGTGLYIDALVFGYKFNNINVDTGGLVNSIDVNNKISICRCKNNVLDRCKKCNTTQRDRLDLDIDSIVVGISTKKEVLNDRIRYRAKDIFNSNVVQEATKSAEKFGWDNIAMTGNIYPIIRRYMDGFIDKEQMVEDFCRSDIHLAKRQMTWFRKNPYIIWSDLDSAREFICSKLR